jgi:beta-N-acetylhexosaminidase
LQSFMVSHQAGGFILMGNNIPESPEELAFLTGSLSLDHELPALVAIDEEGGFVTRLPYDGFAGANSLRNQEPAATLEAFSGRAALLRSVGVNVNFGIDADVTADPQSFIFDRTFGDTPDQSALRVAAAVDGETPIVASTLKHFPGHGSTTGDSHISIPATAMSEEQWRATDAVPFAAGIDAGAPLVMFGHLAFTAVDSAPASLSVAWHQILRDDLGFTGIAITDDMSMLQGSGLPEYSDPVENAIAALAAGNDLLLYVLAADPSIDGIDPEAIVAGLRGAIESGRISESQVNRSALRVLTLRRSFAASAATWLPPCPAPCRALVDALPSK